MFEPFIWKRFFVHSIDVERSEIRSILLKEQR